MLCFQIAVLIPYEQVVAALAADTLDQVSCLGLKGHRFMPEEFSQLACVSLKVKNQSIFALNIHQFELFLPFYVIFIENLSDTFLFSIYNYSWKLKKYEKGIQWLHDLLYKTQFTKERLEIVGKKMMNDVAR